VTSAKPSRPRLRHAGDTLVLIEIGAVIDPDVNGRAVALARAIESARVRGVLDVVPAYASVGVHVDPRHFDPAALDAAISHAWDLGTTGIADSKVVEVPVCYGGPFGPDLPEVAAFARCSEDDVVRLHTEGRYRVYMLGFLPGFAYLGGVHAAIAMPRRPSPRMAVPAGSVGIAGQQTGVYPVQSPGGWRLIGRTPRTMFDAARKTPALLAPGDIVRFVAIPESAWGSAAEADRS
jgi:inhibitor of KinA